MLAAVGAPSLDELIGQTVPAAIRLRSPLPLARPMREHEALAKLKAIAAKNVVKKSLIGMGYYDTLTPKVILRNLLENPGWYTAYTPYQAEIAQGRLEALLNYQQMVIDLTGLELANASLLDEATAAAEAMTMARRASKSKSNVFFVDAACFPQTIDVVKTRAGFSASSWSSARPPMRRKQEVFGALLQYPNDRGEIATSPTSSPRESQRRRDGRRDRPDGAGAAEVARRHGRRHRARLIAALRRADGLRRPARRLLRLPRRAQAFRAGPHHRRLGRCARQQARCAWRCRRASSTSAARRPTPTSAPRRCCWPTWPACTPSITARKGLKTIAGRIHRLAAILAAGLKRAGVKVLTSASSTRSRSISSARARFTRPRAGLQPAPRLRHRRAASRSTKKPRARTSPRCSG
jgi:glycine dehydrogenase